MTYEIRPAIVGLADAMRDSLRAQLLRHLENIEATSPHDCINHDCGWGDAMLSLNNFELYRSLMEIKP